MGLNLQKGQKISLDKESGGSLTKIRMGLGWDAEKSKGFFGFGGGGSIDLDASCILIDASGNVIDTVWFRQLKSKDGSIVHTGDNLTGDGDGDDESIILDLPKIPANAKSIIFVVNSFSGQSFDRVANASCRIVNDTNGSEIAKYNLSECGGKHTAMVMSKLYRHNGEWKFSAIGDTCTGKTWKDLMPAILPHV